MLVLIDTSIWTRALRRNGEASAKARVAALITTGSAAWCDVVRLELWAGVRNEAERQQLAVLASSVQRLPITDQVWDEACRIGGLARSQGLAFPACDLVIFACARQAGVLVESADRHYELLESFA